MEGKRREEWDEGRGGEGVDGVGRMTVMSHTSVETLAM